MIFASLYFIGVFVSFVYLSRMWEKFEKDNPDIVQDYNHRRYEEYIMIIFSLFSWFSLLLFIGCSLFNNEDSESE